MSLLLLCAAITPLRLAGPKRPASENVQPSEAKKLRMGFPPSTASANVAMNAIAVLNHYQPGINYHVVSQTGPAHSPTFTVQVQVNGQVNLTQLLRESRTCGF